MMHKYLLYGEYLDTVCFSEMKPTFVSSVQHEVFDVSSSYSLFDFELYERQVYVSKLLSANSLEEMLSMLLTPLNKKLTLYIIVDDVPTNVVIRRFYCNRILKIIDYIDKMKPMITIIVVSNEIIKNDMNKILVNK